MSRLDAAVERLLDYPPLKRLACRIDRAQSMRRKSRQAAASARLLSGSWLDPPPYRPDLSLITTLEKGAPERRQPWAVGCQPYEAIEDETAVMPNGAVWRVTRWPGNGWSWERAPELDVRP